MSVLVPDLTDLGFVRETLIFKTWNLSDIIGYKYGSLQYYLSNVLLFWKQWREAPGTGSPSFPISSTEIPYIISAVSLKVMLLYIWYFVLSYPLMSSFQNHRFDHSLFNQLGLMKFFPRWIISGLFIMANLYRLPCITGFASEYKNFTIEIKVYSLSRKNCEISFGSL